MVSRAVPIEASHRAWASAGDREAVEARSDESLLRDLERTGGDDVFDVLVRRYRDKVFRLVASVLGPGRGSEVEDVVQEVFVQVFRKLGTFRRESVFSTWLFRIAKNHAIDRLRDPRFRRPHVGEADLRSLPAPERSSDPERLAQAEERRVAMLTQIAALPEPQRTVVYLRYWMDSEIAEIAELLEMNSQTVKSHLFRARRRLARDIEGMGTHDA